jgi:fatty-acyl-CoA synthase
MNIAMLLEMAAEGDPDRIVLGPLTGGLSASGLLKRSRQACAYFAQRGVPTVGFFGLNGEELPVALFGAALAGIPFSPINYRAPDEQLKGILARVPDALMIADANEVARLGTLGAHNVVTKDQFIAALEHPSLFGAEFPFVDPDEVGVMLFTSGTTSEPKAAVLRHRHLVSYIITTVEFLGCSAGEAQLICVPPYHIAGVAAVLSSLYAGRRIMYLPAFDAREWVRTAAAESITTAMVVPTMLGRILDAMEELGTELPHLRHLSYGGGRMPLELVERTLRDLPEIDLVNAYGLTETSSTIAMLTPDEHRQAFASDDPAVRARLGSVGRPLPALEVEVRGEAHEVLSAGEKGEIWVRGEQVAGEYVGAHGLSEDGWFATRDEGWFDDAGYLYVDGRLDDVIVRGAENISPGEIEQVLMAHPAVAEAAVVGIPDTEWGEAVAAVVVLHSGPAPRACELQQFVRESLRSTKMPSVVEFRDELPHSSTGKLLRRQLRLELSGDPGRPPSDSMA